MPIKSVLAYLGYADAEQAAAATAVEVARRFQAHVRGFHVRPDPRDAAVFMAEGLSGSMLAEVIESAERDGQRHRDSAHARFKAAIAAASLALGEESAITTGATASWGETVGHDATGLAQEGRVHDLIVMGRPGDADGLPSMEAVEAALFGSGRPVLLVPDAPPAAIAESVAVGWNGSAEAARAVARALPLLLQAKKVNLVAIAEDAGKGPTMDRAALYLKRHGVKADTVRVPGGDGRPAGEAMLAEARRLKADMLVIGAYSHSRMRELVLGGVTRHMLQHADLRVFAAH